LFDFIRTRPDLESASAALFELVLRGVIQIAIGQRYALKDAAQAHADLQKRRTTGSTILIP
jgi:NADPH:quinone reductase